MLQQNFDTLTEKINDLYDEKCQLEQFVSRFKCTNRNYLKIKCVAEQIVNGFLTEQRALLTSAIMSVVPSPSSQATVTLEIQGTENLLMHNL